MDIDPRSEVPVYVQIARQLRSQLIAREIVAGSRLPTVRELARDLRLNHNTVAAAYRLLEAEGWLTLGRRRGAVVIERPSPKAPREAGARFASQIETLVTEARSVGIPSASIVKTLRRTADRLRK